MRNSTAPQNENAGHAVDPLDVIRLDAINGADDNDVFAERRRFGKVNPVCSWCNLHRLAGVKVVDCGIGGRRERAVECDPDTLPDELTTSVHERRELAEVHT